MKYLFIILTILSVLLTSFFLWIYQGMMDFVYNLEGNYYSVKDGVVYHEQAKEVYGLLAFASAVLTLFFIFKIINSFSKNSLKKGE